jgi:hypothetical protein
MDRLVIVIVFLLRPLKFEAMGGERGEGRGCQQSRQSVGSRHFHGQSSAVGRSMFEL